MEGDAEQAVPSGEVENLRRLAGVDTCVVAMLVGRANIGAV